LQGGQRKDRRSYSQFVLMGFVVDSRARVRVAKPSCADATKSSNRSGRPALAIWAPSWKPPDAAATSNLEFMNGSVSSAHPAFQAEIPSSVVPISRIFATARSTQFSEEVVLAPCHRHVRVGCPLRDQRRMLDAEGLAEGEELESNILHGAKRT
jgi:hypothetical protein